MTNDPPSPYPYTPPPVSPEEPSPIALPQHMSGIATSFPITYNWTTDHFQIGNAAFANNDVGLRKLAQYLIHFTPPPSSGNKLATSFPTARPRDKTSVYSQRRPRKEQIIMPADLADFLDNAIEEMDKK